MPTPTTPRLVSSDVARESPVETAAVGQAAAGMQAFAHRLLSEHPELFVRLAMVVSSADAVFEADHPFAFAVLHDATGSPLFEGVVGDPTGESTSWGS